MTLDDLPPPIKECLAAFETLRKLGFPADEIFFLHSPKGRVGICLHAQGREFVIGVGSVDDQDPLALWSAACELWLATETPETARDRLYYGSKLSRLGVELIARLIEQGFQLGRHHLN